MISRDEAIQQAGATYAALHSEVWETYLRGGPRAVAEAARPGGSEAELQRLTEQAERWAHRARKRGG